MDGKYIETASTDPASWFRVYPSLDAGMQAFVNSKRTRQWKSTWPFVESVDPEGYARELKRLWYYTAPLQTYVDSMKAKLAKWMASTAFDEAHMSEADTVTELPDSAPEPIVHTLNLPGLPGFEPPDEPSDAA